MRGEIWRLITPIFMHGGFFHLGFNMLWLYQLGGEIERQERGRYLLVLILIMGALVNTCQYLVSGPMFLGMSGIVYMLFGYVWMMARYQAKYTYSMAPQTVTIMLAWLVICLVGLIPGVANTEHVAGLLFGVAWGFFRSGYYRTVRRRRRFRR
jgi:GlpG protein